MGRKLEITRLYPQYNYGSDDRRKNNAPVGFERRSGADRRTPNRISFDSKLNQDIVEVKNIFQSQQNNDESEITPPDAAVGMLNAIPYIRRFTGIEDAVVHQDYIKAVGKGFLQFINVRGDLNDLTSIFKESKHSNEYQKPFSFISGTCFEGFDKVEGFYKYVDKTLFDISFVQKALHKIGLKESEEIMSGFDKFGLPIISKKMNGNLVSKILGRACLRIPVLSFAFLGLLEIPSIIKEKNHGKQAIKSLISVSSVISFGAILGAIGASIGGPLGSLVGLGIGSWLGNKFAKHVNNGLFNEDKIKESKV